MAAQDLFRAGRYLQCLFFAHLVIEKLSKAHWVQDNAGDQPPCIHNLARVLAATTITLTPDQEVLIAELNKFQLEGRYPDYTRSVYQIATSAYTQQLLQEVQLFRQCLPNTLP